MRNDRRGTVAADGITDSVYSEMRTRSPIFEGVKYRDMLVLAIAHHGTLRALEVKFSEDCSSACCVDTGILKRRISSSNANSTRRFVELEGEEWFT